MKEVFRIIKEWFARDHTRLALFLGIFSAGLSGYSLGILRDTAVTEVPLSIHIVSPQEEILTPEVLGDTTSKKASSSVDGNGAIDKKSDCTFVGSKNSTLYHLPSCASARRIKDVNKRCFASAEDALAKGYRPGCLK